MHIEYTKNGIKVPIELIQCFTPYVIDLDEWEDHDEWLFRFSFVTAEEEKGELPFLSKTSVIFKDNKTNKYYTYCGKTLSDTHTDPIFKEDIVDGMVEAYEVIPIPYTKIKYCRVVKQDG